MTGDDIVVRVSRAAEGGDAVLDALVFARELSRATGGAAPSRTPA